MISDRLQALSQSLVATGPFAFCGIAVQRLGQAPLLAIGTAPQVTAQPTTQFRVASVSKIVTAAVILEALRRMGLDPSSPRDASEALGFRLRHPHYDDVQITIAALAAHTSGLKDFTVPADMPLREVFAGNVFLPQPADTTFAYSNAGYILLAEIAQNLSGTRFDQIARDVLSAMDVQGSFNWLDIGTMPDTLPTFRHDGQTFVPKIDHSPQIGRFDPEANVAQFSPQGGLRTSLSGMLAIAGSLRSTSAATLWSPKRGPFDPVGGVFESYGWGLQIFATPVFYPRPLIGHFGNAYGFNGGVWYDRQTETAFAYALNGVAEGDESDAFSAHELSIFQTIAAL